MEKNNTHKKPGKILVIRIIACLLILLSGVAVMSVLSGMKKPPEKKVTRENPLEVEIISAKFEDVPLYISGYGEVKSLKSVSISPEISGTIVYIHPNLETGGIIKKGEVLFKTDSIDYQNSYDIFKKRLKTLKRNLVLSKNEYLRTKKLYEENNTGTLQEVESSEKTYNSSMDQVDQVESSYKTAIINLNRCVIKSPFNARVTEIFIEKDQFTGAGTKALTLADDSILEIMVPVDSREAKMSLGFKESSNFNNLSWFKEVENLNCKITWTGDKEVTENGILHRVVKFDSDSRTVQLAIRIISKDQNKSGFPVVDGMFVKIEIPGKTIKNVIKVPRNSVSFENTVYISENSRLKTIPVIVEKTNESFALISSGLNQGDFIITSKIVAPLENALLRLKEKNLIAKK
ncbi:MAG: efflux RND transporter periplasmic adaptor subunit [Desulfobacula sp.]|nr:efflux RND transporter periplasmic adaptor subunit [Desulfobacula sp.]